jgi:hypothetical protein
VTQKKEFGGLGIPNLADMNLCPRASWVKRYNLDNNKLWKQIIDHKYNVNAPKYFLIFLCGGLSFLEGSPLGCKSSQVESGGMVGKLNLGKIFGLAHPALQFSIGSCMFWLIRKQLPFLNCGMVGSLELPLEGGSLIAFSYNGMRFCRLLKHIV